MAFPAPRGVGPAFVVSSGLPLDRPFSEVIDPLTLCKRRVVDATTWTFCVWTIINGGVIGHCVLLLFISFSAFEEENQTAKG